MLTADAALRYCGIFPGDALGWDRLGFAYFGAHQPSLARAAFCRFS